MWGGESDADRYDRWLTVTIHHVAGLVLRWRSGGKQNTRWPSGDSVCDRQARARLWVLTPARAVSLVSFSTRGRWCHKRDNEYETRSSVPRADT
ncbi:hypothetical protein BaRGS_00013062 [Batillaria attramentaria]|uniref:Uncharacterized protein n=1 Tax=Batillaria attramentaria TaxID=370345 RepID=A0ABD0L8K0_9CAEN